MHIRFPRPPSHVTSKGSSSRMCFQAHVYRQKKKNRKFQWLPVLEKIVSSVTPGVSSMVACLEAAEIDTRFSALSPHPIDSRLCKASGKNHSNLPAEVWYFWHTTLNERSFFSAWKVIVKPFDLVDEHRIPRSSSTIHIQIHIYIYTCVYIYIHIWMYLVFVYIYI